MLNLEETTERTRELMLEVAARDTYAPANLTGSGLSRYRELLAQNLAGGNVNALHADLTRFPSHLLCKDKRGVLPVDWARRLVITDWLSLWNCARARELMEGGETHAIIVRAAPAYEPRGECLQIENMGVPLELVASGFRAKYHPVPNKGAFSLPVGPNCHHGLRRLSNEEARRQFADTLIGGVTFRAYS